MRLAFGKRVFRSILGVWVAFLPIFSAGCADLGGIARWLPFQEKPTQLPGVTPPAERIADLRELAEQGPNSTAEQRQRVAEELAAAIRSEADPLIRAEIVRTLGRYPCAMADAILRAAMHDPEQDVCTAACEAWGNRGDAEAVALLGRALTEDADVDVRLAAVRALGRTKDPAAVAALGPALGDADPAMQYRAVESLRQITGEDFGNDVGRWQQYVRGELPQPARPVSIAERLRRLF